MCLAMVFMFSALLNERYITGSHVWSNKKRRVSYKKPWLLGENLAVLLHNIVLMSIVCALLHNMVCGFIYVCVIVSIKLFKSTQYIKCCTIKQSWLPLLFISKSEKYIFLIKRYQLDLPLKFLYCLLIKKNICTF